MFEEAEDMVDYFSLVTFALEQPPALRAAVAVSRLRRHMLALRNSKGINLRTTLEAFLQQDGSGGGLVLRQAQLDDALRKLGFT